MMQIYSLLDRKLKEYGQLVLARNDEGIRRSVVDGIRGSKSVVELHPEDFDVMHVGEFDVDAGVLTSTRVPRLVANVKDVLEAANAPG